MHAKPPSATHRPTPCPPTFRWSRFLSNPHISLEQPATLLILSHCMLCAKVLLKVLNVLKVLKVVSSHQHISLEQPATLLVQCFGVTHASPWCISLLQGPQGATVFYISLLQDATPSHIPLSPGTLLHIGGMLFHIDILLLPSAFAIFYYVRPF